MGRRRTNKPLQEYGYQGQTGQGRKVADGAPLRQGPTRKDARNSVPQLPKQRSHGKINQFMPVATGLNALGLHSVRQSYVRSL